MNMLRRVFARRVKPAEEVLVFERAPKLPGEHVLPFAVRELSGEEFAQIFGPRGTLQRSVPRAEMRRRRAMGDRAIGAFAGGQIAHVAWLSMTGVIAPEECPGQEVRLPAKVAYLYHCFTFPEFRRRGAYAAVLEAYLSWPGLEDVPRFIACSPENEPSLRAIERAGFRLHTRLQPQQ